MTYLSDSSDQLAVTGVSRATVDRVCGKSRPDIQKSQGGWPTKLKPTDKHRLVHLITSGKADSTTQVLESLGTLAMLKSVLRQYVVL